MEENEKVTRIAEETDSPSTVGCENEVGFDEAMLRAKLDEIVEREVAARLAKAEKPTLDDGALVAELLARPELMRKLAAARDARMREEAKAYPRFVTGRSSAPATVYPEPKTIREASESLRRMLGI